MRAGVPGVLLHLWADASVSFGCTLGESRSAWKARRLPTPRPFFGDTPTAFPVWCRGIMTP
jgi:hypothetical protein